MSRRPRNAVNHVSSSHEEEHEAREQEHNAQTPAPRLWMSAGELASRWTVLRPWAWSAGVGPFWRDCAQ
ncbi:hypothetical protein SAMN05445850_6110 [Paraburkholderia tuberum]|uniref:Uncharacterized protein n=1 Tax=Paraburkholderia tuberum TaxID=157910 RepID=A0A1H1K034_9BURK|nr:hypothetical protein SAMN05445850_6110 [Paraburkholderia tuberum]